MKIKERIYPEYPKLLCISGKHKYFATSDKFSAIYCIE